MTAEVQGRGIPREIQMLCVLSGMEIKEEEPEEGRRVWWLRVSAAERAAAAWAAAEAARAAEAERAAAAWAAAARAWAAEARAAAANAAISPILTPLSLQLPNQPWDKLVQVQSGKTWVQVEAAAVAND